MDIETTLDILRAESALNAYADSLDKREHSLHQRELWITRLIRKYNNQVTKLSEALL